MKITKAFSETHEILKKWPDFDVSSRAIFNDYPQGSKSYNISIRGSDNWNSALAEKHQMSTGMNFPSEKSGVFRLYGRKGGECRTWDYKRAESSLFGSSWN
jgi:hypothetical protein